MMHIADRTAEAARLPHKPGLKRPGWLALAWSAIAMASLAVLPARAQDTYPTKPIRLVVGYAPGGSADLTARLIAEKLRTELGQTIIVDNRAGAGGNIGADIVAHAPPDGYTLLLAAAGQIVINPSLYKHMGFDPAKDLMPITQLQSEHNLMVVNTNLPVKTVAEFVAYAKANPTTVTFASPGIGSPAHLAGELMNHMAGLSMTHIPYKGTAPAMSDLIAGNVTLMIDNMPALLPQVKAGKLRALAVASDQRATAAPDIPTIDQSGLKGYVVMAWKGLMAPAGTPPAVIARVHDAAMKVLADPEIRKRMTDLGAEPVGDTPAHFAQTIKTETAQWSAIVKATGATAE